MPRKRRKRTKRLYFTQRHEDAIIEYNKSLCPREKSELYRELIQPALSEMVDKIVFTYKFTTLPNIEDLRDECKGYLTTILGKYKPEKGSKAFSYFSVITKNWFIHKVKKNNTKCKREMHIEDLSTDHMLQYASISLKYDKIRQDQEFWNLLWQEIEQWETMKLKENEEKVLQAIKILLRDKDNPELIFNKKAIYLYIREITGLNTKQVVNNLNKIRAKYKLFRSSWDEGRF
jgi:DNA-directed RNA polymerase specialized sigma subunit